MLLKSAHAVEREFRVQKALAGSDVPVARMHVLCEDDSVIGSAFYVMDLVRGRNFDEPRLPDLDPQTRRGIYDELNRVLAAIHGIDLEARELADYGPGGNYYRRQIDRWTKQYRASETGPIPAMDELIAWLDANVPEDDGRRTLVHGDYRIDNLLFAVDGPACVAVLDWELSTIGHPFADLAALIMQWQHPPGTEGRGWPALTGSRWAFRKTRTSSTHTAPAWGSPAFRVSVSTWPSPSSAWGRSCRASRNAPSTEMPPIRSSV